MAVYAAVRDSVLRIVAQRQGLVVPSLARLPETVERMVESLDDFRTATARIDNRAVFEIPELLADLLAARQGAANNARFVAQPRADSHATAR